MRSLMVLTPHSELGNTAKEDRILAGGVAAPYYAFVDAGVSVTLASLQTARLTLKVSFHP